MKKLTSVLLALAMLLTLAFVPATLAAGSAQVVVLQVYNSWMAVDDTLQQVDAQSGQVYPIAENNRTLVPVSRIVAAFGGSSSWDAKTNDTTFTLNGHTVTHRIGNRAINIDGRRTVIMDTPSKAMNNRTYVPLRAILEGLGLTVNYEGTHRLAVVSQGAVDQNALDQLPGAKLLLGTYDAKTDDPDYSKLIGKLLGDQAKDPAPTPTPTPTPTPAPSQDDSPVTIDDLRVTGQGGKRFMAGHSELSLFDLDFETYYERRFRDVDIGHQLTDYDMISFALSRPVSVYGVCFAIWSDSSHDYPTIYGGPQAITLCASETEDSEWVELLRMEEPKGEYPDDCWYFKHQYTYLLDEPSQPYQYFGVKLENFDSNVEWVNLAEFILLFDGAPATLNLPETDTLEYWEARQSGSSSSGSSGSSSGSSSTSSGVCPVCHGMKKTICKVCWGKGYTTYATGLPGKDAYKRTPCPSLLCQDGWCTCAGCGGTGRAN